MKKMWKNVGYSQGFTNFKNLNILYVIFPHMKTIYREQMVKLVEYGMKISDEDELVKTLKSKHYSRFIPFILLLSKWNLNANQKGVFFLYRIDVILRRMIMEELKPVEVSLATQIANYFQIKEYDVDDVATGKFADNENCWISIGTKKQKFDYLLEEINVIIKRRKYTAGEIVMELTFGQKITLLTLINIRDLGKHFDFYKDDKYLENLRKIKLYRNLIAHHQWIIPKQKGRIIHISQFIDAMNEVVKFDFKKKFKNKIIAYKNNFVQRLIDEGDIEESEILKNIFSQLIIWLNI